MIYRTDFDILQKTKQGLANYLTIYDLKKVCKGVFNDCW